jgi:hypothetical protein
VADRQFSDEPRLSLCIRAPGLSGLQQGLPRGSFGTFSDSVAIPLGAALGLFAGGFHRCSAGDRLFPERNSRQRGDRDCSVLFARVLQQPLCCIRQRKSNLAGARYLGSPGILLSDRSVPVVVPIDESGTSEIQASLDKLTVESEWEIKSRGHCCARTGRQFEEGEYFYTLLFREGEGFRREDISEEAWANRNENIEPFSFWRSRYEKPTPPSPEPLPREDAESLLRTLMARRDPASENACFILALMLERKRILRPMESRDPDLLVYEHAVTGEMFIVKNPNLSLENIPAIQNEVYSMLGRSFRS